MQIGDNVRHKETGQIAEVAWSSFGYSLHWYTEEGFFKTPGAPAREILEDWEPTTILQDTQQIIHTDTEDIICPYCGIADNDSRTELEFEGTSTCSGCEETFGYNMTITYTTHKEE
jgi:hypothetical protein